MIAKRNYQIKVPVAGKKAAKLPKKEVEEIISDNKIAMWKCAFLFAFTRYYVVKLNIEL